MTNAQSANACDINTIYSAKQIQDRLAEMGAQIAADYKSLEKPVVIGVLKGALIFFADLVRNIHVESGLQMEFVRLASYGSATESSGKVQTPYLDLPNLYHRHILVVEDIVDSGRTAKFFMDYLREQFSPATLKLAVFLDKPSRRVLPIEPDYTGFEIKDLFVVGYGLDYAERYRELPFLGELVNIPAEGE